jgi:hypothetical protein
LANAGQLFGLSAECALKAAMLSLGMTLRPDGTPADRQHCVHLSQLWKKTKINGRNPNLGKNHRGNMSDGYRL